MPKLELTNMVMVRDPASGRVVVQDRIKSWKGIALPGGHAEDGESIYDSAVREIKEETGLDVRGLVSCGFMHWFNSRTGDRYFTYFYKTTDYSGTLLEATDEGRVFWTDIERLRDMELSPNFMQYLPMFLEGGYSEAYCSWNEEMEVDRGSDNPWGIIYR